VRRCVPMADLLWVLRALEVELHRGATRADRPRMDALLHPDFIEFGRSGTVWTREATLDEFAAPGAAASAPAIHAQDFVLRELADGLALLTYLSAHESVNGTRERFTLRSSLWQLSATGAWRLRFHQGTPVEP
jgi:hypothetical protein